jgi:hypothetical protein
MVRSHVKALFLVCAALFSTADAACIQPDDANFASIGGGCTDLATGNVWSIPVLYATGAFATQGGGVYYCDHLVEGGQSDWRLPNIAELQTVGADDGWSYLDLDGVGQYYWSTNLSKNKKTAYAYSFLDGNAYLLTLRSAANAICVRTSGNAAVGPVSVPEPDSQLLVSLAAIGMIVWRRRAC